MLQLDADDRLAIASLQSPRETSFQLRIVREAAILIPCATIYSFSVLWPDHGAPLIGFGLYAAYQIYLSFTELVRNRRLGQILISYEEDRQASLATADPAGAEIDETALEVESGEEIEAEDAGDEDAVDEVDEGEIEEDEYEEDVEFDEEEEDDTPRGTAADVAACFERASDETALASAHYQTAAKRFRKGNIPRGTSHAFAALGHLQAARREARIAAGIHADHPYPND